jgi:hypothetical protein
MTEGITNNLQNLATSATGGAHIALNDILRQVRAMQAELDRSLGTNVKVPLETLSLDQRTTANQLYAALVRIADLLAHERECIAANAEHVVAALRTAVESAKEGIPFVETGAPWLSTFRFDGLTTANFVPARGGRLTVSGYKLWPFPERAPTVRLLGEDRQMEIMRSLNPSAGADANSFSITIPEDVLRTHAGNCLALEVTVHDRVSRFLVLSTWRSTRRAVPLCVPDEYERSFRLTGNISYSVPSRRRRELQMKEFPEGISRHCGSTRGYRETLYWNVPDGFRIVSFTKREEHRHDDGFQLALQITERNAISATGVIAKPRCTPFSTLISHAYWRGSVTLTVEGTVPEERTDSASVDGVRFTGNQAQACVLIPRSEPSDRTTYWYTVIDQSASGLSPLNRASTRKTVSTNPVAEPDGTEGGYTFDVNFNPTPVTRTAELCVTLRNANRCGF